MNCLRRNLGEPECSDEAAEEAEEATRQYVTPVVGSARIRGVSRVMPAEGISAHSKEPTVNRKENRANDAIPRDGYNRVQTFSYSRTR